MRFILKCLSVGKRAKIKWGRIVRFLAQGVEGKGGVIGEGIEGNKVIRKHVHTDNLFSIYTFFYLFFVYYVKHDR